MVRKPAEFFAFLTKASANDFAGAAAILGKRMQVIDIWEMIESISIAFRWDRVVFDSTLVPFDELSCARCIFYHPESWDSVAYSPLDGDTSHFFAKRQLLSVCAWFERWLELSTRVSNSPSLSRLASNKLLQLHTLASAHKELLVATDLTSSQHGLKIGRVVKHVSETRVIDENTMNYAQLIDGGIVEFLSAQKGLPVLCQDLLNEPVEYRAYLFGRHRTVFEFSRSDDPTNLDVHLAGDSLMGPRSVSLPNKLVESLSAILFSFGIQYGAIDFFIVDGSIRVLELNPLPSWAWLPKQFREKIDACLVAFATDSAPRRREDASSR